MSKNIFLATAAAGVMAFAGAASAHTLTYQAGPVAGIDATEVNTVANLDPTTTDLAKYGTTLVGKYLIAQEALGSSLGSGVLALADPLSGGTLPSGNNIYRITLSNATFGTAVTSAALVGANCTAVISSGGAATDSSVTFLVSSSGGGNCAGFTGVNIPVKPTAAGAVSVTSTYTTEGGAAIDGGSSTLDAIYAIDAFQPVVDGSLGAATNDADLDTTALIAGATPYTTLGGDGNLGTVSIYVDTRAERSLDPTGANVSTGDVTAATVVVTGEFAPYDGAAGTVDNPTLAGQATTVSGNTATLTGAHTFIAETLDTRNAAANDFVVAADGGVISGSTYTAAINYTLTAANFAVQPAFNGNLETIEREGTTFIAPWVGGSQSNSQSVIRLSSTGIASGGVFVSLTNAYTSGNVAIADPGMCSIGPVPAAGDLVIGQPQLTACFGPFVRGDVIITVEAAPASLTAKMRNSNASGNFETTLGRYSGSTSAQAAF